MAMLLRGCRQLGQRWKHWVQVQRPLSCGCHSNSVQTRSHKAPLPASLPLLDFSTPALSTKTNITQLDSLFSRLSVYNTGQPYGYILPTAAPSNKKTIIEPLTNSLAYDLPTFLRVAEEKVEPDLVRSTPIWDPTPVLEKRTRAKLIIIRHKMMKKHKLRKLRKRMIFTLRKQRDIGLRKKRKALDEAKQAYITAANAYNPEDEIEQCLKDAKMGGWYIDTLATWKRDKSNRV